MTPLLGFTPDIDPTTPGAMPYVSNLLPTQKGMIASPTGVAVSGELGAVCRGIAVVQKTSGERRTIAGTGSRLHELATAGTWATISGSYAFDAASSRWSFAQFGDLTLASNYSEAIQSSTSGTFAAIAGAPKAKVLVSAPNFVLALNTADATASVTYGTSPDRWWCCAFQDPTSWTVNATTQATSGRLIGKGGEITAGAPFGNGLVVFKKREMFLGQYAGPPTVFDFQRIPGDQGCVGPEAVADIGGALFFVGDDNIWIYDGSRPRPVGQDVVRRWFFDSVSSALKKDCVVRYDASNSNVWLFFTFNTSSRLNTALVYNLPTNKWGVVTNFLTGEQIDVSAVVNYVTNGLTWDTFSSISTTWNGLPALGWDSEAWQASGNVLAFVDADQNILHTLNGLPDSSNFRTNYFGSEMGASSVNRLHVRFATPPSLAATCQGGAYSHVGQTSAATTSNSNLPLGGSNFDVRQTGRWHQFSLTFAGNAEVIGVDVQLRPAGKR